MLIKQQNKLKFGFSLIELLVVISIIGVLSAVLVANFMGARERARDAQKIQDLTSLKNALRMYYNDNQTYPIGVNCTSCLTSFLGASYMPSISEVGYTYSQTDSGDGFWAIVGLEAGAGDEDINSQTKCGLVARDKAFAVCAK